MSKRRRELWDNDNFDYPGDVSPNPVRHEMEDDVASSLEEVVYLDEAHEALSKLFSKANKRTRQVRGLHRRDAWH